MAKVKIDDVVYQLTDEFKRALSDTMRQFAPNVQFSDVAAFNYFRQRVYQHCSVRENVPDSCVKS